jgi:hypothetical protein
MKPQPSQKPEFHDFREQSYWHMAQDIAFRAGARLEIRDAEVYLVTENAAEFLCAPERANKFWYETWLVLHDRFPDLSRLWPGYVPK